MARIGIIADLHLPFEHPRYREFCLDVFNEYKCNQFVHIGDVTDNHAVAPNYEPDPDGLSAGHEADQVRKCLAPWTKAFPRLKVCYGNHDLRPARTGKKYGLSDLHIRTPAEVLGTPKTWIWGFRHIIDGVVYEHGTGSSGINAAYNRALGLQKSLVMGHTHSNGEVRWITTPFTRIFAMNVGCGIDIDKYAFAYSRDFMRRPVLGCGVVIDGEDAFFLPMKCGRGERYGRRR